MNASHDGRLGRLMGSMIITLILLLGAMMFVLPSLDPAERDATVIAAPQIPQAITPTLYLPLIAKRYPVQTIFGVTMNRGISASGGLTLAVQAQVQWVRDSYISWAQVESAQGVRDWGGLSSF